MSMPADFIAVVRAAPAVAAIVATRIHANVVPLQVWSDDQHRPSICYFWSLDAPGKTFCASDDLFASHFTLHCSAADYDVACSLAAAVIAAVLDYSAVSGATAIETVNLEAALDSGPEEEPGLYTRTVLLAVWHRSN